MIAQSSQTFPGATMTPEGLRYKGVLFFPVIEKCAGCSRIREFGEHSYCSSYAAPVAKWSLGDCNFATHVRAAQASQARVNPLKASKRAAKGGR
ncbi:MAG: PxxKW family cysteine-rich protein [Desulfovibrio sp.]|jgi:hypothetical protein|nr:PxxKW family cysteine-rich protein [Desulfovibrio sp.]